MLLLVQKVWIGVRVRVRVGVGVSPSPNPNPNPNPNTNPNPNPNPNQYEGSFVIVQEITMVQQIHERIYSVLGVRFPDSKVRSPPAAGRESTTRNFRTL